MTPKRAETAGAMIAEAHKRGVLLSLSFAGVLAGAYGRGFFNRGSALTHAVLRDRAGRVARVLCGKAQPTNMSDDTKAPEVNGPATCKLCVRILARPARGEGESK